MSETPRSGQGFMKNTYVKRPTEKGVGKEGCGWGGRGADKEKKDKTKNRRKAPWQR